MILRATIAAFLLSGCVTTNLCSTQYRMLGDDGRVIGVVVNADGDLCYYDSSMGWGKCED